MSHKMKEVRALDVVLNFELTPENVDIEAEALRLS